MGTSTYIVQLSHSIKTRKKGCGLNRCCEQMKVWAPDWPGLADKLGSVTVGLAHVMKIARKPERDSEHNIILTETKIMLQLKIQEEKVRMKEKEYAHL